MKEWQEAENQKLLSLSMNSGLVTFQNTIVCLCIGYSDLKNVVFSM